MIACSTYDVESDGKKITMVSTAWGAKALHSEVSEFSNVSNLIGWVQKIFEQVKAEYPGQSFTTSTRAIGRKMRGFDLARVQLNPTHVVEG
jgi:hypothetical protein